MILKVNGYLLAIILVMYFSIFLINYLKLDIKLSSDIVSTSTKQLDADMLSSLLANEIVQFNLSDVNKEIVKPSILNGVVWVTSNIWPDDIRTFLGRELVGFSQFNTEIAIAGKGTNLATLPIESPPPNDAILLNDSNKNSSSNEEKIETPKKDTSDKKVVYIYHTHSWEAFLPQLSGVTNPNQASSIDETRNVIQVGTQLQNELLERGIGTEHSTTNVTAELKKKGWGYSQSYSLTREIVQEATAKENSLVYLIDIHRDSQARKITTLNYDGIEYARLFFVVGKDNKNYERNLKLAKDLNERLENKIPGISRGVFVKSKDEGNGVYNQDLSSNSILLEFGGVDNTQKELSNTVEKFAEVFSEYYKQVEEVNN
ncbi:MULTISPECIES: stage II sporulation protein P [Niallia]|uniref:Stage II sporulation protein P n=1 Tax=Niallia taxi TaxID=2499688 RepID=A0A437K770_9BACI|nr:MULTISPECIES: stage II sporulation protein P [Niallia]MDK8643695.1 stage II sporulation protein P [Niallia taxi]MED4038298.1 stage II sporulation protein P [Niallia taxi]MED4057587.1 stage II sporulation protein P [Niallia taxi]MED4120617.1 stage II sporulation protein P [Niallia taxi]RVT59451.1 stage II sporulation protein P [Niallia taxi]